MINRFLSPSCLKQGSPVPWDTLAPGELGATICRLPPGYPQFCTRRHPEPQLMDWLGCHLCTVVKKCALQVVLTCESWSRNLPSYWEVFDGKCSWLEEEIWYGYILYILCWSCKLFNILETILDSNDFMYECKYTFPMSLLQKAFSSWQRQQAMFGVSRARSVHARHSTGFTNKFIIKIVLHHCVIVPYYRYSHGFIILATWPRACALIRSMRLCVN